MVLTETTQLRLKREEPGSPSRTHGRIGRFGHFHRKEEWDSGFLRLVRETKEVTSFLSLSFWFMGSRAWA